MFQIIIIIHWTHVHRLNIHTHTMNNTRTHPPPTPATQARTHAHTHTHALLLNVPGFCVRFFVWTLMYTHVHTHAHAHAHAHTHTHTHTPTPIYIDTHTFSLCVRIFRNVLTLISCVHRYNYCRPTLKKWSRKRSHSGLFRVSRGQILLYFKYLYIFYYVCMHTLPNIYKHSFFSYHSLLSYILLHFHHISNLFQDAKYYKKTTVNRQEGHLQTQSETVPHIHLRATIHCNCQNVSSYKIHIAVYLFKSLTMYMYSAEDTLVWSIKRSAERSKLAGQTIVLEFLQC